MHKAFNVLRKMQFNSFNRSFCTKIGDFIKNEKTLRLLKGRNIEKLFPI